MTTRFTNVNRVAKIFLAGGIHSLNFPTLSRVDQNSSLKDYRQIRFRDESFGSDDQLPGGVEGPKNDDVGPAFLRLDHKHRVFGGVESVGVGASRPDVGDVEGPTADVDVR